MFERDGDKSLKEDLLDYGYSFTSSEWKKFDDKIISGREFLVKPDPEIYKLAISRFNLTPEQTLFIDDRIENIEAAQSLGFRTIHLTDPLTIKSQLANHIIV